MAFAAGRIAADIRGTVRCAVPAGKTGTADTGPVKWNGPLYTAADRGPDRDGGVSLGDQCNYRP